MLINTWNRIVNIGAYDTLLWSEKIKVRLLNKLMVITTVVALFFLAERYLNTDKPFIHQLWIFVIIGTNFLLHYKGRYLIPRYIACFIFPITIANIMCIEGGTYGEHVVFLGVVLIGFIFFERQVFSKFLCVAWNIFLGIYSLIYIHYNFNYYSLSSDLFGSIIIFSCLIIIISLFIYFYQKDVFGYQLTREQLLDELQKKNSELESFAYAASHDLKEPLNNIIGFSKILKDNCEKKDYENSIEYLDIITKNANHMSNLVRDTLELVSIEDEEIDYEDVDPNIVVDQIKSLLEDTISNMKATVYTKRKLPVIKAHRTEIFSVFKNLIENGLKYNDDPEPRILIDYKEEGGKTVFLVSDNGYGIKQSEHNKIFEMFKRLHIRNEHEGSGLGLSICKKIVEKMGGEIWVESTPGEGSVFYFSIPKEDKRLVV